MHETACDEESRQHIYALLEKYEYHEVCRLVTEIAFRRSSTTLSHARSSQFSQTSAGSRFSGASTDPSLSPPSSTSSYSRTRRDLTQYRSGINASRHAPVPFSSPVSREVNLSTHSRHEGTASSDWETKSVTSTSTAPPGNKSKDGTWFCTFCTDIKAFGTKSDWKKHEMRHHETGEEWPCPFRNCFEIFDRGVDFEKHCKCYHPDLPIPKDVKILLLPKRVYACGFDGCKVVLTDWDDRCNHVADLHMKKEGCRQYDWKYTTVIRNLLRQDATRDAWKDLFAELESKGPRDQITWSAANTRVLKQKLECCDMRPDVDQVVHTALLLREGRPFNDTVELPLEFITPSQDSIQDYKVLSDTQRNRILGGLRLPPMHSLPLKQGEDSRNLDAHPGNLVEFPALGFAKAASISSSGRRRSSVMDIDDDDMFFEPDPQIPWGLEKGPEWVDNDESPRPRRSSKARILPKSFRHLTGRLSPK